MNAYFYCATRIERVNYIYVCFQEMPEQERRLQRQRHHGLDDDDSGGSTSSTGSSGHYSKPHRRGSIRKSSNGPQYRYIDGERYIREDSLYGGDEYARFQQTPTLPTEKQVFYHTYNYVVVDDDHVSSTGTSNRRRSEPANAWVGPPPPIPKDHIPCDNLEDMEDITTYQVRSHILLKVMKCLIHRVVMKLLYLQYTYSSTHTTHLHTHTYIYR